MTEHDFVTGPFVLNPGEKEKKQQSFVCSLCRRTTTTPAEPREGCPGPSGLGPDRLSFLQLVELRNLRTLLVSVLDEVSR